MKKWIKIELESYIKCFKLYDSTIRRKAHDM